MSRVDGRVVASGVWRRASARHLRPERYRVRPRQPWHPLPAPSGAVAVPPPLLRGYLRLAWVRGAQAHETDFGCADLPMLLSLDRLDGRYLRHFLDSEPTP